MKAGTAARGAAARGAWVVVLAALALAAGGSAASAQTRDWAPIQVAQAGQVRSFSIPAQPLPDALTAFGQQSGMQVSVDGALIRSVASPGVAGEMAPEQALARLLSGTGFTYGVAGGNTITLRPLPAAPVADSGVIQLDPIMVEAQAGGFGPPTSTLGEPPTEFPGGQVATGGRVGLLGNRDVFDTPFSVINFTSEKIRNDQASSIVEIVEDDASIRSTYPRSDYEDALSVRGFPLYAADFGFDGLYGLTSRYGAQAIGIERLELLKGPNALLNGIAPSGSIGGSVNVVPKRGPEDFIFEVTGTYASPSQFGGEVDIGGRLGHAERLGVRFNGRYEGGDIAYDDASIKQLAGLLALDYTGDRFRWSANGVYDEANVDRMQIGALIGDGVDVPDAPDNDSNFYQPFDYADNRNVFGTTRAEVDVLDRWTVFGAVGYADYETESTGAFPTILNEAGDIEAAESHTLLTSHAFSGEAGLRGEFETGPLRHNVVLSGSRIWNEFLFDGEDIGTFASNIYDPIDGDEPDTSDLDADKYAENTLESIAFADAVSAWDDRVIVIGGVRRQFLLAESFDEDGESTTDYDERRWSPAVGVVLKPIDRLSLYANYIEGLSRGPTAPAGTANEGEVFPPYVSKQIEVGAKLDLDTVGATLAYFDTRQPSGVVDPATTVFDVDGEQRHRGVELSVFGEPLEGVRVLGGLTYIDSELDGTEGGVNDGNAGSGVPEVQVVARAEWDTPFLPGLTVWGRTLYTSSQFVDNDNDREIPDWTRFDLGVRYVLERPRAKPIVLRAAVENVFDRDYWLSAQSGYLTQGPPRTFLLSTSFQF